MSLHAEGAARWANGPLAAKALFESGEEDSQYEPERGSDARCLGGAVLAFWSEGSTSSNEIDEMSAPTPKAMISPIILLLSRNAKATSDPTISAEAPTRPQNAASTIIVTSSSVKQGIRSTKFKLFTTWSLKRYQIITDSHLEFPKAAAFKLIEQACAEIIELQR
jgi:hypothetical protein